MSVRLIPIAVALALLWAAPAAAQGPYPSGPFAPWDGSNPFNCTIQDAGMGTTVPDPDADPYCVEFDKTQQNVADLGIFEFLADEPARVAAATPKCFYFQTDHWTGSVVQGQPPELWHWDGQYFFDRAKGIGGVNVQNFRVLGQPASPSAHGEVPAEFAPYMDQDGGGAFIIGDVDVDPACVARVDTPEEAAQIYAAGGPPQPPAVTGGVATSVHTVGKRAAKKCKRHKRAKATGKRKGCKKRKQRR
jgi:hypothetical protein